MLNLKNYGERVKNNPHSYLAHFESKVIRSQQLGLGVGGFGPEVLVNLVENIKKRRDTGCLILISTACRCHGVTSVLSWNKK
jgi:hypothetical protein